MKRSSGMERSQSSTWDTSDENRNKLVKAASTSKLLAKVVKNTERYRRTRSTHKACARYRRCFVDCQPSCVYIDKLFSFRHRDPVMSQGKHTHIFIIIIVCRNGQKASETFQSVLVFEAVLLLFVLSVVGVSQ